MPTGVQRAARQDTSVSSFRLRSGKAAPCPTPSSAVHKTHAWAGQRTPAGELQPVRDHGSPRTDAPAQAAWGWQPARSAVRAARVHPRLSLGGAGLTPRPRQGVNFFSREASPTIHARIGCDTPRPEMLGSTCSHAAVFTLRIVWLLKPYRARINHATRM